MNTLLPPANTSTTVPVGSLNSVSEPMQFGIIAAGILAMVPAWCSDDIPAWATVLGGLTLIFLLYLAAHHLPFVRSSLRFHEDHFEFERSAKETTYPYECLTCLTTRVKDYKFKGVYLMSKIKMELKVEGQSEPIRHEFDFRWGSQEELRLRSFLDRCSDAIETRLAQRLESVGEIMWMPNAYLTMDGIKLLDPRPLALNGDPQHRFIAFEEIEDWKLDLGQFKLWKKGDALPALVLDKGLPNFRPLLGLFHRMWRYIEAQSHLTPQQPVAVSAADSSTTELPSKV